MQTLQQKREYTVAVLDPAGNVTAIVCSDVPAAASRRRSCVCRSWALNRSPS